MINSAQFPVRTRISIALVAFVAAVGAFVAFKPLIHTWSISGASRAASEAQKGSIDRVTGLKAAILLDPANESYRRELASHYLNESNRLPAIELLSENHNDYESRLLYSKALVENGKYEKAAAIEGSEEGIAVQKAAVLAVDGKKNDRTEVKSDESKKALVAIGSGGVALAQYLAANDMPQSALKVLKTSDDSVAKGILWSQIILVQRKASQNDLKTAITTTDKALGTDPSNTELRQYRLRLFDRVGDREAAQKEKTLIDRLHSGQY